jgi:predicted acyltransferase
VAHTVDVWFLNLFPRKAPFLYNEGGYQTLNFVPSIATLILGIMVGQALRGQRRPVQKFVLLAGGGIACLVVGQLLGWTICPIVKRIWTPAWVVYSTGWTLLLLAAFYGVIDVIGLRRWAFPLVVVGMNPILMYLMFQFTRGWIKKTLHIHLGKGIFTWTYGPILESLGVTLVMWLVCLWLYRRKAFIRV